LIPFNISKTNVFRRVVDRDFLALLLKQLNLSCSSLELQDAVGLDSFIYSICEFTTESFRFITEIVAVLLLAKFSVMNLRLSAMNSQMLSHSVHFQGS
jgi:hypothetical protein